MKLDTIDQADCIAEMKKMQDECIDLIVTDPPYLINYKTNHRHDKQNRFTKPILNDNNTQLIYDYCQECYRIAKNNTGMYMFSSPDKIDVFMDAVRQAGYKIKNQIIWVKNNWTAGDLQAAYGKQYEIMIYANKGRRKINGKRLTDVWNYSRVAGKTQLHQNQKPLDLIQQCIIKSSDQGNVVFDGFLGSGTTAVAAINTDRHYIGYELDPGYYDIARQRIAETEDNHGQTNQETA
jgi:site-specific DNA-methyltransferase (adenine-specific)